MARIEVQDRPYLLTGDGVGTGDAAFPLTSNELRRLLSFTSMAARVDSGGYRITLAASDGTRQYVIPATLGGGVPFTVSK